MSINNFSKKKPDWANREGAPGQNLDAGPYIGIVKNNLDPARSGKLQVFIPDFGGSDTDPGSWKTVGYASPFFGHTFQPEQANPNPGIANSSAMVEQTYGMWMVPPDVGTEVLCTFVAGDQDRGYWFACVNSNLSHSMWPGNSRAIDQWSDEKPLSGPVAKGKIAKSLKGYAAGDDMNEGPFVPATEFNEQVDESWTETWASRKMPVHEYQAAIYVSQGLDADPIRGAISSSSQRETPSRVFGISTPGRPISEGSANKVDSSVRSRRGGHSFVMDDGDIAGLDQLIRLRTSAGHQILMNDSAGVVYISNSTGTSWIEMNAAGQVMIYSKGGFAVRSEGDLNLHSDTNVNIQGQNVNINANNGKLTSWSQSTEINASDKLDLLSTTAMMSGTNTATLAGGTAFLSGTNGVNMAGSKCNLNSGSGPVEPISPNSVALTGLKQPVFVNGRWMKEKGSINTIATVAPTHEPYGRYKTRREESGVALAVNKEIVKSGFDPSQVVNVINNIGK